MLRWSHLALVYGLIGALSAGVAIVVRGGSPLVHPKPWVHWPVGLAHVIGLLLGALLGLGAAALTRWMVPRFRWAGALHRELRPFALGVGFRGTVALAVFSAVGEELLFRGLLQPWIGLWVQAMVFGLLHQTRGPSRWVWVAWASLAGLGLGVLFEMTGSLLGCILAHGIINFLNLGYLRSYDPTADQRALGGLLGERG